MKLTVITTWRDEELLAPFFLSHYAFADRIIVFLDDKTTDHTERLLKSASNVEIRSISFPDGFDIRQATNERNSCYREIEEGFVMVADADEFLLPVVLSNEFDVYYGEFTEVYRHVTDADLDPNSPAIPQCRHGVRLKDNNPFGLATGKPCIAKSGLDVHWECGNHNLLGRFHQIFGHAEVVHWQTADPVILQARHAKRSQQQSLECLRLGYGVHWPQYGERGYIENLVKAHENDPLVL